MFKNILPTEAETRIKLPGDDLIQDPIAVIDSAFTLHAPPEIVFPWLLQLGKQRAGWYFTRSVENFILPSKRGLQHIEPKWQNLRVGQRIPDYGGKKGYFDCFYLKNNEAIGYISTRGKLTMTWVLALQPAGNNTRLIIRLRMKSSKPSRFPFWSVGKIFDRLTIAGLAAGLNERLQGQA